MILMRILIYGAGVIGSLYAALFAEAGYDTNIYARGKRLETLRNNGHRLVSGTHRALNHLGTLGDKDALLRL